MGFEECSQVGLLLIQIEENWTKPSCLKFKLQMSLSRIILGQVGQMGPRFLMILIKSGRPIKEHCIYTGPITSKHLFIALHPMLRKKLVKIGILITEVMVMGGI